MSNKIKYGLKSVYYSVAALAADNSATYATPVALPGAVSLTLDAEGETTTFYADNIAYYVTAANNGYSGSLELAIVPDSFRTDVLGESSDSSTGLQYEAADVQPKHFALLFQFEGDDAATRHVIYNCMATRPSVSSSTKETSVTPVTETLNLTATSVYVSAVTADVVKGKMESGASGYANFFTAVVQPS